MSADPRTSPSTDNTLAQPTVPPYQAARQALVKQVVHEVARTIVRDILGTLENPPSAVHVLTEAARNAAGAGVPLPPEVDALDMLYTELRRLARLCRVAVDLEEAPEGFLVQPGRHSVVADRIRFHLFDRHKNEAALGLDDSEAHRDHDHEHAGPGTIRNHDPRDLDYDMGWIIATLRDWAERGVERGLVCADCGTRTDRHRDTCQWGFHGRNAHLTAMVHGHWGHLCELDDRGMCPIGVATLAAGRRVREQGTKDTEGRS
jgi:hypothetical protein